MSRALTLMDALLPARFDKKRAEMQNALAKCTAVAAAKLAGA